MASARIVAVSQRGYIQNGNPFSVYRSHLFYGRRAAEHTEMLCTQPAKNLKTGRRILHGAGDKASEAHMPIL